MKRFILSATFSGAALLAGCGDSEVSESASAGDIPAVGATWLTDFGQAKALAAESNRLILVNFTGSDWCAPCMQLKKDVFTTVEFGTYAGENLVLLEVDFPRQTPQPEDLQRHNQQLAGAFDPPGFPTLVLLNSQGEEIARSVGYMPGGPAHFTRWVEEARGG